MDNQGILRIKRASSFRGILLSWVVLIDNKRVGKLGNGGDLIVKVDHTEKTIQVGQPVLGLFGGDLVLSAPETVVVEPGNTIELVYEYTLGKATIKLKSRQLSNGTGLT